MRKIFKRLLVTAFILSLSGRDVSAAEPIGLAGVYECNSDPESIRKQMYLTIDFMNCDVPDFTQVFTTKENSFRFLPKDFMNAKKLKKYFSGQKAPGFGKYRSKYVFSNTSEFKLTNPRIKDGVIMADWVDNDGAKGECTIIANPDRTIRILGLTELTRDFSPDNITLTMVEDRLPEGSEPFVTPPAVASYFLKEAEKRASKPKVTSFDKQQEIKVTSARQIGNKVEIEMKLRNKSEYESLTIAVCQEFGDESYAVDSEGKTYTPDDISAQTPGTHGGNAAIKAEKGKWVPFTVTIDNVDGRPDWFKKVGVFFNIAGGFFMDNRIALIENLPVSQDMPEEIKPGK